MFQRELLIIATLACVIFLLVAGTAWYVVLELHDTSRKLVVDTLPGLVDTGLAEERMNDNRRVMLNLLAPHTPAERAQLVELVRTNTAEPLWRDYARSIDGDSERVKYQTMMLSRSNYLADCEQFYGLIAAEKTNEAAVLFSGDLSRKFKTYNDAAKAMFNYNVREGIGRGERILRAARYAPWVMGGFCVLVFFSGLLIGVRSALSGGVGGRKGNP